MKKNIINKFKTYSFWISVGGVVGLVIQSFARAYGFAFDELVVNDIITSICGVLVVSGVISAPNGKGNAKIDSLLDGSDDDISDRSDNSDISEENKTSDNNNKSK